MQVFWSDKVELRGHHARGRIQGVLHKASNIWFYPADTKIPVNLTKGRKKDGKNTKQAGDEPVLEPVLGPWANWQAPGFVRMAGRSFQVWGAHKNLGWFGGVL